MTALSLIARGLALVIGSALCSCASSAAASPEVLRYVAACQIRVDGDREATLERIDAALAQASAGGAQVACFPEACLFGWLNPQAHALADPIPGATTERLGELARRHGMMLALGLAENGPEGLHNSVVLIDRDGSLLLRHRKTNILGELMEPPYTPGAGAGDSVVQTRLGRIGLLICADTFDEALVRQVADDQPDLMLVPYGWAAPAEAWPQHGESLHDWIAYTARRTGAPTLGVDSAGALAHGPWAGFVLGGQSAFADAEGKLSAPMADRDVEVRVFEVLPVAPAP